MRGALGLRVILVAIVVAVIGFAVVSYMLSHQVFSYVVCDAGPGGVPPGAFDVVENNGCWTYRMPWP